MVSILQGGVIATLNPMDAVGTLRLDDGSTLRFGASACQGFTPALGVRVRVLATRAHPLGGLAAAQLELATEAAAYDALVEARDAAAGITPSNDPLQNAHTSLQLGWLVVLLDAPVPSGPSAFGAWADRLGLTGAGVRLEPPPMARLSLGTAAPLAYPGSAPMPEALVTQGFGQLPWAAQAGGFIGLSLGLPGLAQVRRLITRDARDPWALHGRLRDFSRLAALLAPHGPGVLLPLAGFALPQDTFLQRLGDLEDPEQRPFLAWTALSWAAEGRRYRSVGLPALEFPDVAAAVMGEGAFAEQRAREAALLACHQMVRQNASLEPGATIEVPIGATAATAAPLELQGLDTERYRVEDREGLLDLVRLDPPGHQAARWAANPATVSFFTYVSLARGAAEDWHRGEFVDEVFREATGGAPELWVEVHRTGEGCLMLSIGAGYGCQPGGSIEEGTAHVEVMAMMERDHPMFANLVGDVAQALHQHPAERVFRFGDTVRLPVPELGSAGFVLRRGGTLSLGAGVPVSLMELVPLSEDEYLRCRQEGSGPFLEALSHQPLSARTRRWAMRSS